MGVFGAVFGHRGDAGFNGPLLGARSGVVGFNVATLSRLVREKVRPARSQWPKMGVFWRAGRVFSRKSRWRGLAGRVFSRKCCWRGLAGRVFSRKSRWRGRAGRVFSRTGSRGIPPGEHCRAAALAAGHSTGSVNPSMRSYTHLAEAGCGRPTRPQQPTPQRKALTKGKRLLVKAVTSLDNGRKWRVYAGRTLELLR